MSILIKGMEMPENCVDCGIYWDGCPVWEFENIDKDYSEKRAPNCPVVPVPFHKIVKTNADRIRAMTDEELADFMTRQRFSVVNLIADRLGINVTSQFLEGRKNSLDWLKQEVDNDKQ